MKFDFKQFKKDMKQIDSGGLFHVMGIIEDEFRKRTLWNDKF